MTNEQRAAQREIAALEIAQLRANAPDARRILSDERCILMAAVQRKNGDELRAATERAARVRAAWSRY